MNERYRTACRRLSAALALFLLAPVGAAAQNPLGYGTPGDPGEIDFERPESWAMKYYTSVSLLTGLGVPGAVGEGNIALGFEGGFIPTLSDEQRRVGFNGTKLEDLNKTSAFGRIRFTLGLTRDAELTLAYVPPVELNGAKPNLFAAAVGVPVYRGDGFRVGGRIYGQIGSVSGDFTCDAKTAALGDDPVRNPYGCNEASDDTTDQVYIGLDLGVAAELSSPVEPYFTVGLNRFQTKFETHAITAGTLDNSTFETSGFTFHGAGGVLVELNERFLVSGELFYSPLMVQRPGETSASSDGLLNGRGMIQIRF